MSTLHQEILAKFLARLEELDALDEKGIEELRKLLGQSKKAQIEDLAKLFRERLREVAK